MNKIDRDAKLLMEAVPSPVTYLSFDQHGFALAVISGVQYETEEPVSPPAQKDLLKMWRRGHKHSLIELLQRYGLKRKEVKPSKRDPDLLALIKRMKEGPPKFKSNG